MLDGSPRNTRRLALLPDDPLSLEVATNRFREYSPIEEEPDAIMAVRQFPPDGSQSEPVATGSLMTREDLVATGAGPSLASPDPSAPWGHGSLLASLGSSSLWDHGSPDRGMTTMALPVGQAYPSIAMNNEMDTDDASSVPAADEEYFDTNSQTVGITEDDGSETAAVAAANADDDQSMIAMFASVYMRHTPTMTHPDTGELLRQVNRVAVANLTALGMPQNLTLYYSDAQSLFYVQDSDHVPVPGPLVAMALLPSGRVVHPANAPDAIVDTATALTDFLPTVYELTEEDLEHESLGTFYLPQEQIPPTPQLQPAQLWWPETEDSNVFYLNESEASEAPVTSNASDLFGNQATHLPGSSVWSLFF